MESQTSIFKFDTIACVSLSADASLPSWQELLNGQAAVTATEADAALAGETPAPQATDAWTAEFTRRLQAQHARVREFLQLQRDRWRQVAARFIRQIETLQAEVHALRAADEGRRAELLAHPGEDAQARAELAADASGRYLQAIDEIRDLKARNAELQRKLLEAHAISAGPGAGAFSDDSNWESQKRRFLAGLESEDQQDAELIERRLKIEEIVARTDKIVSEKEREIEELHHLLESQSNSLGSLAVGAAALEQVFDEDAIVREERQRLKQLQEECRAKLRVAEIEIATERARLARREAEVEEKFRNNEIRQSAAESEALAPTGRPVRGRWRTQMGLTDDGPEPGRCRDLP